MTARVVRGRLRKLSASTKWWFRRRTARWRALPDVLIIGTMKGGTSSAAAYLSQHPQLRRSSVKEVRFFDSGNDPAVDAFELGPQWYRAHFPLKFAMRRGQRTFEASPGYLFHPDAARRIADLLPGVKLVVLLRNPTDRAISNYRHQVEKGRISSDLATVLARADETVPRAIADGDFTGFAFVHESIKERGLYADQLDRYAAIFPAENLFIDTSERLFADPNSVLSEIFAFLGVADYTVADVTPRNVGRAVVDIDPKAVLSLDDYYAPHNQRLLDTYGIDVAEPEARG